MKILEAFLLSTLLISSRAYSRLGCQSETNWERYSKLKNDAQGLLALSIHRSQTGNSSGSGR